ncbi:hypothetical protein LINGRAHAP2_LOCUS4656, partial [Linum grandiflorum]
QVQELVQAQVQVQEQVQVKSQVRVLVQVQAPILEQARSQALKKRKILLSTSLGWRESNQEHSRITLYLSLKIPDQVWLLLQ